MLEGENQWKGCNYILVNLKKIMKTSYLENKKIQDTPKALIYF